MRIQLASIHPRRHNQALAAITVAILTASACTSAGVSGPPDGTATAGASEPSSSPEVSPPTIDSIQTTVPAMREGSDNSLGNVPPDLQEALASLQTPVILAVEEMLGKGPVSAQAAKIDVPVLVACGDYDVIPDLHAEPAAYSSSPHVTITEVPDQTHTYWFDDSRAVMFERKRAWMTWILETGRAGGLVGP